MSGLYSASTRTKTGVFSSLHTSSIIFFLRCQWWAFEANYSGCAMEREHLRLLFNDLSQIMLIIMLITLWIINELGQFWQISVKINFIHDICVYTDISKSFSLHEYKIWHVYTFKNLRNVNTTVTILYQFMIILCHFWEQILAKNISKNCAFFALFWHILGKIQVVPKENLVKIVTLDIFKLYMSNKADRYVQKCSKFIFKCFHTPNLAKWHDACRIGLKHFTFNCVITRIHRPPYNIQGVLIPLNA